MPALFNPFDIKQVYGIQPTYIQENVYSFKDYRFKHGLIVKAFDIHSISSIVSFPLCLFVPFQESCHPKLVASESTFPKPLEWDFSVGNEVDILNSKDADHYPFPYKRSVITALQKDSVEANLANVEGVIKVP
jgi:hypothetical protein